MIVENPGDRERARGIAQRFLDRHPTARFLSVANCEDVCRAFFFAEQDARKLQTERDRFRSILARSFEKLSREETAALAVEARAALALENGETNPIGPNFPFGVEP